MNTYSCPRCGTKAEGELHSCGCAKQDALREELAEFKVRCASQESEIARMAGERSALAVLRNVIHDTCVTDKCAGESGCWCDDCKAVRENVNMWDLPATVKATALKSERDAATQAAETMKQERDAARAEAAAALEGQQVAENERNAVAKESAEIEHECNEAVKDATAARFERDSFYLQMNHAIAEAAALRQALMDWVDEHGAPHSGYTTETHWEPCPEDDTCDCELVAQINAALASHAGSALLARLKASEDVVRFADLACAVLLHSANRFHTLNDVPRAKEAIDIRNKLVDALDAHSTEAKDALADGRKETT